MLCVPEGVRKPLDRPLATESGPLLCSGSGCTAACKYKCIVENSDRLTSPHTHKHTHIPTHVGWLTEWAESSRVDARMACIRQLIARHIDFLFILNAPTLQIYGFSIWRIRGPWPSSWHGRTTLASFCFSLVLVLVGPDRFWSVLAVRSARRLHLAGFFGNNATPVGASINKLA